jgi:hypothetical protein
MPFSNRRERLKRFFWRRRATVAIAVFLLVLIATVIPALLGRTSVPPSSVYRKWGETASVAGVSMSIDAPGPSAPGSTTGFESLVRATNHGKTPIEGFSDSFSIDVVGAGYTGSYGGGHSIPPLHGRPLPSVLTVNQSTSGYTAWAVRPGEKISRVSFQLDATGDLPVFLTWGN